MGELPRCSSCRVAVLPGESIVFRADGRVQHLACPQVICPACSHVIDPDQPIRRDGDRIVHGNCWARLDREAGKPPVKIVTAASDARSAVRAKLDAGTLPRIATGTIWAGRGTGQRCNGCDQPITLAEIEHEVERRDADTLRFHRECLHVWQAEVGRGRREISGGSDAAIAETCTITAHTPGHSSSVRATTRT